MKGTTDEIAFQELFFPPTKTVDGCFSEKESYDHELWEFYVLTPRTIEKVV